MSDSFSTQRREDAKAQGDGKPRLLFSFEVTIRGMVLENPTAVNAISPGQAKMEYLRMLDGCLGNVKFTDLLCRKLGGPTNPPGFKRNADYRGLPTLNCGDRVKVHGAGGTVVGHNSSANFVVLFDKGTRYDGGRLSVHPSEMEVVR